MDDSRCTLRREDLRALRVLSTTGLRDLREMPYDGSRKQDDSRCTLRREDLRTLRVLSTTGLRDLREMPYDGCRLNVKGELQFGIVP